MATNSARPRNSAAKTKVSTVSEKTTLPPTHPTPDDMLATLKSQFKNHLRTLHELFSEWNDEDLIAVLQEVKGDLEIAIMRISEGFPTTPPVQLTPGHAQQWSTLGKKSAKREQTTQKKSENVDSSVQSYSHSKPQFKSTSVRGRDVPSRGRGRGRGSSRPVSSRPVPQDAQKSVSGDKPWADSATAAVIEKPADGWSQKPVDNAWGKEKAVQESVPVAAPTKSSWAAVPVEKPAEETSKGWAAQEVASSWSAEPVQPIVAQISSKPVSKPLKKGTWADIAKPDPPKPQPAPVQQNPVEVKTKPARDTSPKRSARPAQKQPVTDKGLTATSPEKVAAPIPHAKPSAPVVPAEQQVANAGNFPPGLTNSPARSAQPKFKKDAPVVMPNNQNVGSVGVTFGSLSLNNDSEAIESKKTTPIIATRNSSGSQSGYLKEQALKESAPVQPQVSHYYQQTADYPSYDRTTTNEQQQPPQLQPHQPGMPYPPNMSPANLANMYAAYFPIYMNHLNQFGGNPYAPQQNPAHYNQAYTAAMKQGYYAPNSQVNAPSPTGIPQTSAAGAGAAGSAGKPNQNAAGYSTYYNMGVPMQEDMAQEYAKYQSAYQQAAYQQQAASQSKDKGDKSGQNNMAHGGGVNVNAAYYNQMMHAGAFGQPQQQQGYWQNPNK